MASERHLIGLSLHDGIGNLSAHPQRLDLVPVMGVDIVDHEDVAKAGILSGNPHAGSVDPQLLHHLGRRASKRLAPNDWTDGDAESRELLDEVADARDGQDGSDADEGVRGADHKGPGGLDGGPEARRWRGFGGAIEAARAIVICPSNPFVSVAPILAVAGVRDLVQDFSGLRVAVSPIVGGKALRGPAAKMMEELGIDATCVGVAREYAGFCDVFVFDEVDAHHREEIEALGMRAEVADTVMETQAEKVRLARHILGLEQ